MLSKKRQKTLLSPLNNLCLGIGVQGNFGLK